MSLVETLAPATGSRRLLPGAEAARAVRAGIMAAARDCERWGGLWPTDHGCENLLQVRAAEQLYALLARHDLGWLTLEQSISAISLEGTSRRGRRPGGLRDSQRADLAIWSKSNRIYALVEVKRAETNAHWLSDLVKLGSAVATFGRHHGNHLRYAIFGAFISRRGDAGVRLRAEELSALAGETAMRFGLRARTVLAPRLHRCDFGPSGQWACGAATVMLSVR